MHTKDILADAMIEAGLPDAMVKRARDGYYHDFLSPLATPELVLAQELAEIGTPKALAVRERLINGDFDASTEESDEWADSPEGQDTFKRLTQRR